jgi:hypothetical protein
VDVGGFMAEVHPPAGLSPSMSNRRLDVTPFLPSASFHQPLRR